MKLSKKLNLIMKAIRMTFAGYKMELLRNKIKKYYIKKGIGNGNYLQGLIDKYNIWQEKFNALDTSYLKLKDSMIL